MTRAILEEKVNRARQLKQNQKGGRHAKASHLESPNNAQSVATVLRVHSLIGLQATRKPLTHMHVTAVCVRRHMRPMSCLPKHKLTLVSPCQIDALDLVNRGSGSHPAGPLGGHRSRGTRTRHEEGERV